MKNLREKVRLSLLLVLAMVVSVFIICPHEVQAAGKPAFKKTTSRFIYVRARDHESENSRLLELKNFPKNGKITEITSSDSEVAEGRIAGMNDAVSVVWNKAGTATLTAKVKVGSGTYTMKCNIVVKNYENPAASIKIGKKEYKNALKTNGHFNIKYKNKAKYKVSVKARPNWKLKNINYNSGEEWKKIKNRSKIIARDWEGLNFEFYNKKTKVTQYIYADFFNYECPVASLKVGDTECMDLLKDDTECFINYNKGDTYKLSVECKPKWELKSIRYMDKKTFENNKTLENNSEVTVGADDKYGCLEFEFYNKKAKAYQTLFVNFNND